MELQNDVQSESPARGIPPEETAAPPAEKSPADAASMSREEYEKLLDMYDVSFKSLAEGQVVKGKILKVLPNEVIVDVGYKSEGIIHIDEFTDSDGKVRVSEGDEVDVLLEKHENKEGYVVLSKEKAEKVRVWETVEAAYASGSIVTGRVIERIKGGLAVDIGVRAFLPGSLVDVRPVRNLDSMRGKEIRSRVIKVNRRRGNIVLSRKAVLEEENQEKKKKTLEILEEGKRIKGVVKNITGYGAFLDLGGIDGLLHITDMSWGRINHPSELFAVGAEVEVIVLKFDRETERVSLGYKQLKPDPWEQVGERYPAGSRVKGKVVSLTDYGAFVELEEGVEGLVHVSEMSWTKKVKHPSKILSVGSEIEAAVLDVDLKQRRLSLGLKQIEPNPWDMIAQKYEINSKITGKVRNLTDFGAFVEVEEGVDGLIHISDLSWTKRIKHPSEMLKKGDEVEAIILKIDAENQRLSLGLKQLTPNVWDEFFDRHVVGDTVSGRISRIADFGVFVEIVEGVEGLVHVSELAEERVEHPKDRFSEGDEIRAKIIKMDTLERKVGLSIKAADADEERSTMSSYMDSPSDGSVRLGDVANFPTPEPKPPVAEAPEAPEAPEEEEAGSTAARSGEDS
ncbi:MAG TPA: 30S ribosomal protein S1 [Candidatus Saccharimonadales bacterium]|nr:30S ribosomal protein S1 [Candidatus Saccharimonadales bacterium]